MSARRALTVSVAIVPFLLSACAGILGIDQAAHDSKLDDQGKGGSGNVSGSGGSDNGGTDSGVTKTVCDQYCDAVLRNCPAPNAVYTSRDVCIAVCKNLDEGAPGDDGVNTVQCRLHYAESAGSVGEPTVNCPAAGPGGDGVCGTNCEGFCSIALKACSGKPATATLTVDSCAGLCANLPDSTGYNDSIQSGNSVQCRLYHASAASIDPSLHCPHVAGIGPCNDPKP